MKWTPTADHYIVANYGIKEVWEIAEHFGVNEASVMSRAGKLGLRATVNGKSANRIEDDIGLQDDIRDMASEGYTKEEIVDELQLSQATYNKICKAADVRPITEKQKEHAAREVVIKDLHADGLSVDEIMEKLELTSRSTVYGVMKDAGLAPNTSGKKRGPSRPFTAEEDATLLRMRAEGYNGQAVADALGRTRGKCYQRASDLKLGRRGHTDPPMKPKGTLWTEEEDKLVEKLYQTDLSHETIGKRIGRTKQAVQKRRERLGWAPIRLEAAAWTKKQEATLRKLNKQGLSHKEVGEEIGRTVNSVQRRITKLGLTGNIPLGWSDTEDKLIAKYSKQNFSSVEITALLNNGRSRGAVQKRVTLLRKRAKK